MSRRDFNDELADGIESLVSVLRWFAIATFAFIIASIAAAIWVS